MEFKLGKVLENLREKSALVHNITNYVTVNDCANILLASGASPIMSDDIEEVEEITTICNSLNINIGTLNKRTVESMIVCGKKANELNHPIILDPVGVGASTLRNKTVEKLLDKVKFTVIRGNISEIKGVAINSNTTVGVDANISDMINDENISENVKFLKGFAYERKSIVVVTGAIDIITDGVEAVVVRNGHPMMSKVTGTGCMLSALIGGYIGANDKSEEINMFESVVTAVVSMGIAGERAYKIVEDQNAGNSSYRNFIIDEIYKLDKKGIEDEARYEFV